MLKPKIEKLLNEQIVHELYSANLYLNMASWLSDHSLPGYAHWYYNQYQEEVDHAMIFFGYIAQAGDRPVIGAIDAPEDDWADVRAVLAKGLEHEQFVTSLIYNLVEAAEKAKDYKTVEFLRWFVSEQLEEEDNASTNLGRYDTIATDGAGLHALDAELGARVYTQTTYLDSYKM